MLMDPRSSDNRLPPDVLADARFWQAFAELLKGSNYAEMTSGNCWDYAVEIHVLRRFGLSDNDLRLLVQKRFVEHAREVTTERTVGRSFTPATDLTFAKRTCFVLTALGIAKAHCRSHQTLRSDLRQKVIDSSTAELELPAWNAARRQLTYDGQTVKQFARKAVNQELVLSAFEEEGWPAQILSPLEPDSSQTVKRRLNETVRSLNHGQVHPLIHFHGDGTGEGIVWRPAGEAPELHSPRLLTR